MIRSLSTGDIDLIEEMYKMYIRIPVKDPGEDGVFRSIYPADKLLGKFVTCPARILSVKVKT